MLGVVVFFNILSMIYNPIIYDLRLIKLRHKIHVTFFEKPETKIHEKKITFLTSQNAWGYLLSDVKIYDAPGVPAFIFGRVPIE